MTSLDKVTKPNMDSGVASPDRVLGWDLLRGCCAYGVAAYHLLTWQKVADIHSVGFYAVYLFFVLSGASLALNYYPKFASRFTLADFGNFLFVRYMRLLPLFAILVFLSLPWKIKTQGLTSELLLKLTSNLSFLFGFGTPLTNSMIVGGWSLGIEFVFYLLFPIFLIPLAWGKGRILIIWVALLALQFVWIAATVGSDATKLSNLASYHQVPAFAAYFFGGCVIGFLHLQPDKKIEIGSVPGVLGMLFAGALIVALNTDNPATVLFSWRATLLVALCFATVWWCSRIVLVGKLAKASLLLGNVTYGVYLIHPFLYFGVAFVLAPRMTGINATSGFGLTSLAIGIGVLVLTTLLAYASERWLEKPVRHWCSKHLQKI